MSWEDEYFRRFSDYFDDADTVKEPLWQIRDFIRQVRQEVKAETETEVRKQILEDIFLPKDHTPDYILDHPDGRIRKAYEEFLKPKDFTGTSIPSQEIDRLKTQPDPDSKEDK